MAESKNDDSKNLFYTMDAVPKFTGDDITYSSAKWTQDLDDNADIFGWSQQQKLIIARRCLAGTAELWLKSEKTFRSYEELKVALMKEFPEVINSKQMHETMSRRKKQPNESFYQYMLVMKELGKRAKFPDYVAIQYIIDGISDYESNKLLFYGVTSYSVLKEKLVLYESFKEKSKKSVDTMRRGQRDTAVMPRQVHRCYNCGERGHLSSSCRRGIKCFKCNGFGHKGTECRASQGMEAKKASNNYYGGGDEQDRRSMFVRQQEDDEKNENELYEREQCDLKEQVSDMPNFSCQQLNHIVSSNLLNVNKRDSINMSVKSVKVGNYVTNCLIDTGSDLNLITFDLFTKLKCEYIPEKMLLTGLGSSKVYSIGKFDTDLTIDSHRYSINLYIVPTGGIPYDVILGQQFLVNTITVIDKGLVEVRPPCYDISYQNAICLSSSSNDQCTAVREIIDSYTPLKTKDAPIRLKIVLKDDVPVSQRPRRLAITEEQLVKQHVDALSRNILFTDRGTAFTGSEFREYCEEEDIEHVTITTGIPRGNGQVERMNSIIISALTKMCIEEPGHWYKYTSKLQQVINSTYQRAICTTPFELLTGVKLKLKEDLSILEYLEEENRLQFMNRREEARREAKAQILRMQEENRKTYNKRRKVGEMYKVGDLVAIQRTQFGNALKLKPKFYGPYRITREMGKGRYEVEKIDRSKDGPVRTTSALDFMKRWP
ncbi:uncharacterized protein LOC114250529 isoform X1 [Bombyx mandarina]|nr:uncharacterized protein LOC114250529 isoform X1 [Bombyx mandarina]